MPRRPPERRCLQPLPWKHEDLPPLTWLQAHATGSCSMPFKLNPSSHVRYIFNIIPLLHQCFCDFHGIFLRTNAIYNKESLATSNELVYSSKQQARHNYSLPTLTNYSETNFLLLFHLRSLLGWICFVIVTSTVLGSEEINIFCTQNPPLFSYFKFQNVERCCGNNLNINYWIWITLWSNLFSKLTTAW